MTRAAALLAEVERRGATAYRLGDRIRVRPAENIPPDLLEELRQHKAGLLPLVAEQPEHCWQVVGKPGLPLKGPIVVNDWLTITNPVRCAEDTLLKLELAVAYRNAGHEPFFKTLIDGYVARLAACGVYVQVQNFS